jgi:zincin-like metallopeptidase
LLPSGVTIYNRISAVSFSRHAQQLGIVQRCRDRCDPGQHAAYVASWIQVLEEDPLEIFRAAADAEKIQKYLCSLQQRQSIVEGVSLTDALQEYDRRVDGPESRKQLEKENPALVATRDRAVIVLRKEQLQKELAAKSQALPLRF